MAEQLCERLELARIEEKLGPLDIAAQALFMRILSAALLVLLSVCGCFYRPSDPHGLNVPEQIGRCIIEHNFAERESAYSHQYEKDREDSKNREDPFGGGPIIVEDDRRTVIYEPYCVQILGKDPSAKFIEVLDRPQHPIKPGSSFNPHPRSFKERTEFARSNPPALFSISKIDYREDNTALVGVVIYRNALNAEGWSYILRRTGCRWTVVSKALTHIS